MAESSLTGTINIADLSAVDPDCFHEVEVAVQYGGADAARAALAEPRGVVALQLVVSGRWATEHGASACALCGNRLVSVSSATPAAAADVGRVATTYDVDACALPCLSQAIHASTTAAAAGAGMSTGKSKKRSGANGTHGRRRGSGSGKGKGKGDAAAGAAAGAAATPSDGYGHRLSGTQPVHVFHSWCLEAHLASVNSERAGDGSALPPCPGGCRVHALAAPERVSSRGGAVAAFDFGGVIVDKPGPGLADDDDDDDNGEDTDTVLTDVPAGPTGALSGVDFLLADEVPGALCGLATIVAELGSNNVCIVSKAREKVKARSTEWMAGVGFFEATGMLPTAVHYCPDRAGKRPICEREGATVFVDDRVDVLGHLEGAVRCLVLFCRYRGHRALDCARRLPEARIVSTWPAVVATVLGHEPVAPTDVGAAGAAPAGARAGAGAGENDGGGGGDASSDGTGTRGERK